MKIRYKIGDRIIYTGGTNDLVSIGMLYEVVWVSTTGKYLDIKVRVGTMVLRESEVRKCSIKDYIKLC